MSIVSICDNCDIVEEENRVLRQLLREAQEGLICYDNSDTHGTSNCHDGSKCECFNCQTYRKIKKVL